ncbi:MAG: glycoside hydrolase family 13 protein [Candidatus Nanopelagicales bacterium]|nr:glycoside hydrolase family 13 protein [Candidatus Nanopelagicales bacterium]
MLWWHNAAVYQVYPRSFMDGNGDSLGDLQGIKERLPYLVELGVDALWLSPFYPSPQHDSGYDVANPRDVDPMFGTLADAQSLIDAAHARNLRIIVDLVPNHFSIEHPWFQEALAAGPGSAERARFHFVDSVDNNPPNNWVSIFGGPAWTRTTNPDGSPGQWYLHIFDSSQPDLNWTNADIAADWITTLRFWLDMGVDGFRVDVALGMAKDMTYADLPDPIGLTQALRFDLDNSSPEAEQKRLMVENSAFMDRDEIQDIYATWREVLNSYPGDRMAVSEAWVPAHRAKNYVSPTSLHQIFGFDFLVVPWNAEIMAQRITKAIAGVAAVNAPPTWALSNHDSPRVATRLGGGVVGLARARALAVVAHALPGSIYVFQGEELGLENADLPDSARQDPVFFRTNGEQLGRDGARVPMPWSGSAPPYGFSTSAEPTWLPQPEDWAELTVEAEQADPASTWNLYRELLHKRRSLRGELTVGDSGSESVMVFHRDNGVHVAINTGSTVFPMHERFPGCEVTISSDMVTGGKNEFLPPDCAIWFRV